MSTTNSSKKVSENKNNNTNNKNNNKPIIKNNIIKPLNPSDFDSTNVEYSNVINNTEIGTKWVNITYNNNNNNDSNNKTKLLIVARGCIVKTFKKVENKDKDGKIIPQKEGRKDKYQIFLGLKDDKFVEFVESFEEKLISVGVEKSESWFDSDMTEEECRDMFKKSLSKHEKYGPAIGGILARDFTCKSKTEDVPDVSDLMVALAKNTVVDACFSFNIIKLGVGKYSIGYEINQLNITDVGSNSVYESNAFLPEDYTTGKITLGELQQHEKGGKFCKVLYEEKPLRFKLENITGRIFRFEQQDGGVSYSMSIRLTEQTIRKMIESINDEIFNILLTNSKDYYGSKKTAKLLKALVKSLVSFNKADQEKIKKGEKPTYDPSVWIKIFYSDAKGFDGKIINAEDSKVIANTNDLINKDLNISTIEVYSRHIWFGPKGTSVNLTMNKCGVSYDVPVYDMDDISEKDEETKANEDDDDEEVEDIEAVNSDTE
jgi:hypothetical protein